MSLAEATEAFCWKTLRSMMTGYGEHTLREFAAAHPDEVFYCLCVYFDSTYGDFFLYLNDPPQARKTATRLKETYPSLYGHKTVEEVEASVKWNCGDFRYSFYNDDRDRLWNAIWRPIGRTYERLNSELFDGDQRAALRWGERFAETTCLVALDLERSEALAGLKRTPDFRVICVDHDETMAESDVRLDRVRETYTPIG